jgi:tetratricopeptide (TPR) repeat protein
MTTTVQTAASHPHPSRRQEILEWYDKLPRRSFSELLGVPRHADAQAARTAFRALVKRFHPDGLGPAEADLRDKAQAVLMQITDAYETALAEATPTEAERPAARPAPPAVVLPMADQPLPPVAASPQQRSATASPEPPRATASPEPPRATASPEPPRATTSVEPQPRRLRVQDAIEEAQAYMGRKELDAAVDVLYEVVQLADDDQRGKIRLLLATAYVADPKRRRNALTLLSDIVREEPSNVEALMLLGKLYSREGLLARAESTLARAVAADPRHAGARASLVAVRETVRQHAAKGRQTHGGGLFARLLSKGR